MNIIEAKEYVLDCIAEELDGITSRHMKSLKRYPTIEDNLKYLNKLLSYLKNDSRSRGHRDEVSHLNYIFSETNYYRDVCAVLENSKKILLEELQSFIKKYSEFLSQQVLTELSIDEKSGLAMAYEDYWLKNHLELNVVMPRLHSVLRTLYKEVA